MIQSRARPDLLPLDYSEQKPFFFLVSLVFPSIISNASVWVSSTLQAGFVSSLKVRLPNLSLTVFIDLENHVS